MKHLLQSLAVVIVIAVLTGCSSVSSRTQKLQLGMSKADAIKIIKTDHSIAGARRDAAGQDVEVLKFEGDNKSDLFLYFRDDKLVQWGDQSVLQNMPKAGTDK
jgi:uncharacterized protein YceK